jgi:hypothetical protein
MRKFAKHNTKYFSTLYIYIYIYNFFKIAFTSTTAKNQTSGNERFRSVSQMGLFVSLSPCESEDEEDSTIFGFH